MKKLCISKNWTLSAAGTNGSISVDLPNDYSITQPRTPNAPGGASNGFFQGGHGSYIKKLDIPSEPKHYILDIDGSYMLTTVTLNNIQLAKHPHGYTPLLVDLTDRIKFGAENELKLKTNALQCSTRWYSGAGVYRDVFLWEGGDIRIEPWDIFVTTPTLSSAKAFYDISSDRDAAVLLRAYVIDENGVRAAEAECEISLKGGEKTHAELTFDIPNAKLWDVGDPHLYTLSTEIIENESIVETDETSFGVRTISADARNGLLLNGRSIKLRGGCIHHDHGVLGAAEYPTACRRKLEKLQSAGFNAVRIAHNPPSTTMLELCDKLGIILMDEAFDCWRIEKGGEFNYHVWFDDWWERDIAAMVKRDRKHPSVIAFSIGNEIPESDGHSDGDEWSKRLSDEIRKYDSSRLVTSATFQMGDGETHAELTFDIPNAKLWDVGDPHLYTLSTEIIENESIVETDETSFGVRTISADARNGLLLNGRSIKLRGGCIHHDHGVLGAAEYPTACRRKLEKLQSAGFNAVRIAHNPPSTTMLELCDKLGIILMDEAFDCWRIEKGGEFNYHVWFDDWWERDIAAMVKRDRKHPSVIAFSIGNEIPESDGHSDGDEWSKRLSDEIRKYDSSRLVTSATFQMGDGETWAERTKGYYAPLDICGYNYLYNRYESDHELFPDRVIWGSETHAINFHDSWHTVLRNSYVIGDFTWTAYDNLGEAGTGRSLWARDGHIPGISLAEYPWRACYQGDFDLCGYRRPQSYFREAVWVGGITRLYTTHPEHYGEGFSGTGWHWYDVLDSWTFENKYLGKPVKCEVYTDADEVEWFINGRSLGRSKPEKAIAVMDVPYERGVLSVVSYKNGEKHGEDSLKTVGNASGIRITPETASIKADNRDLCYFDISIVDENGDRVPDSKNAISCEISGGTLCGIFSGDPKNEDQYGSSFCHAFEGRAVAIVKTTDPGKLTVTIGGEGLCSASASVICE